MSIALQSPMRPLLWMCSLGITKRTQNPNKLHFVTTFHSLAYYICKFKVFALTSWIFVFSDFNCYVRPNEALIMDVWPWNHQKISKTKKFAFYEHVSLSCNVKFAKI